MDVWREDLLNALHGAEDAPAVFRAVVGLAQALGFDHCAYGMRQPFPLTQPRTYMVNDYPEPWQRRYMERNYLAVDPTVRHGAVSVAPVLWTDALFEHARDLWDDARAHGLRHGWAQSSRSGQGVMGLVSLSRSEEALTPRELRHNEPRLVWLAQGAHQAFSRVLDADAGRAAGAALSLSAREAEVLRWTADGKTASEVAEILNISERTVNFHIANAVAKLRTPNKAAAVVRAVMLGLLY